MNILVEDLIHGPHVTLAEDPDGPPAQGYSRTNSVTGCTITRISDVSDLYAEFPDTRPDDRYPYALNPGRGLTNGYSTWSDVSSDGLGVLAFGWQPWVNALYSKRGVFSRVMKHTYSGMKIEAIGERNDPRWVRNLGGNSDLIYGHRDGMFKLHLDSTVKLMSFPKGFFYLSNAHADQSTIWRLCQCFDESSTNPVYKLFLLNLATLENREITKFWKSIYPRGGFDMSPSGEWCIIQPPNGVDWFVRTEDLWNGNVADKVDMPTVSYGHCSWALDGAGNEVFVFQDNKTDWFSTFNPATGERINIFNMSDWGYDPAPGWGQHFGKMTSHPGWVVMSCYAGLNNTWHADNLFLVEIKSHEQSPRLVRLGKYNKYNFAPGDLDKTNNYFAENFACASPDGNDLYVGANWHGRTNLELYKIDLRQAWAELESPTIPAPEPVPDITVVGIVEEITIDLRSTSPLKRITILR